MRAKMLPKMYSSLIFAILLSFSSAYGSLLDIIGSTDPCSQTGIQKTIRDVVTEQTKYNKGLCAAIIRLHFHDCFVRGCDGSVLLSFLGAERYAEPNLSLGGFDVIKDAKDAVVKSCAKSDTDGVVSCADILTFAARDCVNITGGFFYDVSGGRLDGKVSIAKEAVDNLPMANFTVAQLTTNFGNKGLDKRDLVALTGAHSIGVSHCSSFRDRLDDPGNVARLEIDGDYKANLIQTCTSDSVIVPQDVSTPDTNILDSKWYTSNLNKKVLFFSDWVLLTDQVSNDLITLFSNNPLGAWQSQFTLSMQKMGQITDPRSQGAGGEIRRVCSAVN